MAGCVTAAATRVGNRTCEHLLDPGAAKVRASGGNLTIAYRCSLFKPDFSGLSRNDAGEGTAIARFRIDDLFSSAYEIPAEHSSDRSLFHFGKIVPRVSGESAGKRPCVYITDSDDVLHFTCGKKQGTVPMHRVVAATDKSFSYRALWGYPLLPVVVPVGVAVDIVATPLYVAAVISLEHTSMCDRDFDSRKQAAQFIAYDW